MTNVLVTGAAGFVGSHVVEGILKETDWNIVVLDSLNYAASLNRLSEIYDCKRVKFVYHDLRSPINELVSSKIGHIDYVLHLAAESHVQNSLEDAIPFATSNVVGTVNLLEWLKTREVKKICLFSTDEVFGPAPEGVFYKEQDVLSPSNPYSASKMGQEAFARAFAVSFGMPIFITRSMNIYGEKQHPEKFIPMAVKAILEGRKVSLHGTNKRNSSRRCWIHARNVAHALIHLLKDCEVMDKAHQQNRGWGVYHIVGEEHSAYELADLAHKVIRGVSLKDKDINYVDYHKTRPGHDFRYALSGSKLKRSGFKYQVGFEESFTRTVEWTINHPEWLGLSSLK